MRDVPQTSLPLLLRDEMRILTLCIWFVSLFITILFSEKKGIQLVEDYEITAMPYAQYALSTCMDNKRWEMNMQTHTVMLN